MLLEYHFWKFLFEHKYVDFYRTQFYEEEKNIEKKVLIQTIWIFSFIKSNETYLKRVCFSLLKNCFEDSNS